MSKISFNIRHLRELKKLSQEGLADELNITRARLGAYEEARNEPPIDMLINMSDYFHVSIDAMIRTDLRKTNLDSLIKIGNNRMLFPVIVDKENNDKIEVITEKATAGYLSGYADPEYIEKMPLMGLPFKVNGKHRTFTIKGDSMPPLKTGDHVIGKYVESIQDIKSNKTYILLTKEDGIVYKRIFKLNNNSLELHSDNRTYLPYLIKASEVLEVWEFVCSMKKDDVKETEASTEEMMKLLLSMKVEIESLKK